MSGSQLGAAYEAALSKLDAEHAAQVRLVHEQIRADWNAGVPLIDIAKANGMHYRNVMQVVRVLGLYERLPKWPGPDPNEMPQLAE